MNDVAPRIEVLRPQAGDTIVVHIDATSLSNEQRACIREACIAFLPVSVKVMVLDRGTRLTHIVTADAPLVDPTSAEAMGFDAWMRVRTERAHREFMERISRRLPCDVTTEDVARYMGTPL